MGNKQPSRAPWEDWVEQAEHDLAAAKDNRTGGWWDVAAVLAEQAGEKAAKALWLASKRQNVPRTHAVDDILANLGAPDHIVAAGRALARTYWAYRYPNSVNGAPFRLVREADADERIRDAEEVLEWVRAHPTMQ